MDLEFAETFSMFYFSTNIPWIKRYTLRISSLDFTWKIEYLFAQKTRYYTHFSWYNVSVNVRKGPWVSLDMPTLRVQQIFWKKEGRIFNPDLCSWAVTAHIDQIFVLVFHQSYVINIVSQLSTLRKNYAVYVDEF